MRTLLDEISNTAITEAIRIHRATGPGMLESVYELMIAHALLARGFDVERQAPVSITFDGIKFEEGFRVDLFVHRALIIEVKSVQQIVPVHSKQLLTYLRMMKLPLGLLINFGGATLKEGIKRVVNDLRPDDSPLLRVKPLRLLVEPTL